MVMQLVVKLKSGDFVYKIKDEYEANVKEGYEGSIDDYIIEFLDPTYAGIKKKDR